MTAGYYTLETSMTTQVFTAVLRKEEDIYVAECPEVGTTSQGYTLDEAIANLREATELYLEEFPLPDRPRTFLTTFNI
jgi:predicted RNase H-like HicB family nuclease